MNSADREAERRIFAAVSLIEGALRLGFDPVRAAELIKPALDAGIEAYASDMHEDVRRVFRR